ncbi:MAG: Transposase [Clostridia bacterium]|jgi:putative transposase|nr:Transposase [Clostridia bacterium]
MSIKDSTREYRLSGGLPIIKECRNSGMSVKNWCEQNDVNEKRFYYWQRKLREAAAEALPSAAKQPTFVQVPVPMESPSPSERPAFIPSMVLKVGNASLELSETVPPELLASVLKVLTHA